MELVYYLRIIGRRWPLALIGLVLTTALTVAFLQQQPLVYRSTGTMIIRPRTVDSGDSVRAIDTLTRGVEISSTYATLARSDAIRQRAKDNLDPSVDTSGTTVASEVVTSTNILEVSVTGGDPEAIAAYASEITRQTVAYVGELQNVYDLQIIDEPTVPNNAIAPNRPLVLGTGVVLGVIVGILFAILADASARPARPGRGRQYAATRASGRSNAARDRFALGDFGVTPGRSTPNGREAAAAESGPDHRSDRPRGSRP